MPEAPLDEMRQAFARSEEYMDQTDAPDTQEQRLQAQRMIQGATPAQLGHVLETLRVGKMGQAAS